MGLNDLPQEAQRISESESGTATDSSKFLEEFFASGLKGSSGEKMKAESFSAGQIAEINIPAKWQAEDASSPSGGASSYKSFHPAENPDVKLSFYYRGRRISEEAGQNFQELLKKPDHVLNAEELAKLKEVIRDKADPEEFSTLIAKTEELNGKRVLIVEGRYKESNESSRALFIDADGTGTAIQELFYQAPQQLYPRYYKPAVDALKSVEWKDELR